MLVAKYGNRKIEIDGCLFDSLKEARRYQELKLLQRSGEIQELTLQKRFELVPKCGKERAAHYIADFVYIDKEGCLVVEDVKSKATKTPAYILKRKLMNWSYGIQIREV